MSTFYDAAGGDPVFESLVTRFFDKVSKDELLMTMYKAEELEESAWRLKAYLILLWGGPNEYEPARGKKIRLRVPHMQFKIDKVARDRWMLYMEESIKSLELAQHVENEFIERTNQVADAMQNVFSAQEKALWKEKHPTKFPRLD